MLLRVLTPSGVVVDQVASKVIAEAPDGSFCLLPRHIDFVAALVPGLLSFSDKAGSESFLALDEGVLVKCGDEVTVATRQAVRDDDLARLKRTVKEHFETLDEDEKRLRSSLARLEANFVRRFTEPGRGSLGGGRG
jgi:F-type H+-transporting ATPase subunit epsilon